MGDIGSCVPSSIGKDFGSAPLRFNIAVSTIPGCTATANREGFSTAKYSIIFACAILEVK